TGAEGIKEEGDEAVNGAFETTTRGHGNDAMACLHARRKRTNANKSCRARTGLNGPRFRLCDAVVAGHERGSRSGWPAPHARKLRRDRPGLVESTCYRSS